MVRNKKGGSGHRRMSSRGTKDNQKMYKLKLPGEEGEIIASVTQLFGYDAAEILCNDGVKRLCIIRKKFRGRNKRDNEIKKDTFVLVGKRNFEVRAPGKREKADLMYVYSEMQKTELKQKGLIRNILLGDNEKKEMVEMSTNIKMDECKVNFDDI